MEKQEFIDALYRNFIETCSYILISRDIVERFVDECGIFEDMERATDLLRDYVLSMGLEEEIVL